MMYIKVVYSLISFTLTQDLSKPSTIWRRDWRRYSKDSLLVKLQALEWNFQSDLMQDYLNELKTQLVVVVDEIAPYNLQGKPVNPVTCRDKEQVTKSVIQIRQRNNLQRII